MCPFYNAQLFEITGVAKGVFTHSQSSCHIAKVVLTIRHDSRQIPIASDARPFHTSRGFLHWRFAYAGPHRARRTTFMGPASANLHKTRSLQRLGSCSASSEPVPVVWPSSAGMTRCSGCVKRRSGKKQLRRKQPPRRRDRLPRVKPKGEG